MKYCILTAAYGRLPVLEIFLEWFDLLRFTRVNDEFELIIAADDYKIKEMAEHYKAHYVKANNDILGRKWNLGLQKAKEIDFDYLVIMGSDDISSFNMFDYHAENPLGWKDIYFYDAQSKRLKYWSGYEGGRAGESIGAGRIFPRKIIEELNYRLWDDDRPKHLDANMTSKLKLKEINTKVLSLKEHDVFLLDIKAVRNMSQFSEYRGAYEDVNILNKYFPNYLIWKIKQLQA